MSRSPWKHELPVDEALAQRLVDAQFPALRGLPARFLAHGWDNTVFQFEGDWIVRFPRREVAAPLLEAECALLPALARKLPLAVPAPEHIGEASAEFPWAFAAYRRIPGVDACDVDFDAAQHVEAIAEFLRSLHGTPLDAAPFTDAPTDTIGRAGSARRKELAAEALDESVAKGWLDPDPRFEPLLAIDVEANEALVLCHGDLDARHVLLDDGAPVAVLDWGDVHRGQRGVDLALVPTYFEPRDWPRFLEAYGGCSTDQWNLARLCALAKAAQILRYAILDGRPAYERMARATLARLAQSADLD